MSRRQFAKGTVATAALAATGVLTRLPKVHAADPIELVHWSWLSASDAEVWTQMIQNFNDAHKDKGVQIKMETVPDDQYETKVLAAAASGQAPDFGWGTAGLHAQWAQDGVIVPLDDLSKQVGLDLADFSAFSISSSRYPKYDNKLFMIPMDLMTIQPEVNLDHVKEAGLDPDKFPTDGDTLIEWAKAMTKRDGDKVTRSGIMMTGSAVQPTITWSIVAAQMGFKRVSDDYKTAARQSRGRQAGHAMGARPLRQVEGLDPRRDQPLQGLRHRPGLDLLDRPLDLERLCPAEAQLPQLCLSQDRQHPPHLSRGGRDGALCAEGHRPLRGLDAGGEVALRQQPALDDQGPRRLAPDLDPEQSRTTRPRACPGICAAPSSRASPTRR